MRPVAINRLATLLMLKADSSEIAGRLATIERSISEARKRLERQRTLVGHLALDRRDIAQELLILHRFEEELDTLFGRRRQLIAELRSLGR
jgi:hypothetical protein